MASEATTATSSGRSTSAVSKTRTKPNAVAASSATTASSRATVGLAAARPRRGVVRVLIAT
jgi:hypothetical protein